MVPDFFIELENVPLTPNGKIDRKSLPEISGNAIARKEFESLETLTEKRLAAIWSKVLGIEKIGRTDNFGWIWTNELLHCVSYLLQTWQGGKNLLAMSFKRSNHFKNRANK